jgi:hypothetical protein
MGTAAHGEPDSLTHPHHAHKKAPLFAERGYSVRTTGMPWQAPVALRNTTKLYFEVSRNEIIV